MMHHHIMVVGLKIRCGGGGGDCVRYSVGSVNPDHVAVVRQDFQACMPVKCNLHRVSMAEVRLGVQPAMDMRMHMVGQGDGVNRRAGIFLS